MENTTDILSHKPVCILTNFRFDASKGLGGHYTPFEIKTIDWHDSSDRKWLMNHLHWAVNNGREVRIIGPEIKF